jgi:hypothetical protein
MDESHGVGAELGGEHSVKRRRGAASLQVAENDDASLAAEPGRHLAGDELADPPESHLPPFPCLPASECTSPTAGKLGSLRQRPPV